MPLPKGWNAEEHCPINVRCIRCRNISCKPTPRCKLLPTGIVEQLYICQGCLWGMVARYDPAKPERHIVCQCITPGKGWGWVKPGYVPAEKNRKIPPPSA